MKNIFLPLLAAWALICLPAGAQPLLLHTEKTTLAIEAPTGGTLREVYYGPRLTAAQVDEVVAAGMGLGEPACPAFGEETGKLSALQVLHADGNPTTDLAVVSATNTGSRIEVTLKDRAYDFTMRVVYEAHEASNVVETWTELSNGEKGAVRLDRFDSGVIGFRQDGAWLTHLHGEWGGEARMEETPLRTGLFELSNRDGARNTQETYPGLMLSLDGRPQENAGSTLGVTLCWSGNFQLRVNGATPFRGQVYAGIDAEQSRLTLTRGERFETPHMAFTFSTEGRGGVSRNFHRWAREGKLAHGERLRDVLLNSWEGVYFDTQEPTMYAMMDDIAALGGELFVMDDGWFGTKYPRNNSDGLGDWTLDERKLPQGLKGLTDHARQAGVKFGIWIEPEAVCRKSELFEQHPDWALTVRNRDLKYGRGEGQLLLDLCNPKVQDFVFGVLDDVMTTAPDVAYIKWDANVMMKNCGSTYLPKDRQQEVAVRYHQGLQNVLRRVREKYPDLTIQCCASGGGRANYGLLPYFDEIWVSDNTDALHRVYIQWGTSLFVPSIAMGQHVSSARTGWSGREIPIKFRFDVASSGRLGLELQPRHMTPEEREFSKQAIANYKLIRPIVQMGDLYRLTSPFEKKGVASLMYVKDDAAVFFAYNTEYFCHTPAPTFRLAGLKPDTRYRVTELNVPAGQKPCWIDGRTYSGRVLMDVGLNIPMGSDYGSRVFLLKAE